MPYIHKVTIFKILSKHQSTRNPLHLIRTRTPPLYILDVILWNSNIDDEIICHENSEIWRGLERISRMDCKCRKNLFQGLCSYIISYLLTGYLCYVFNIFLCYIINWVSDKTIELEKYRYATKYGFVLHQE